MSYMFTVSPDFSPDRLSGWYIFNTWMQRQMGVDIHLELYDDFCAQRVATYSNKIDLIYANPFDAAMLVREKGFLPMVKPEGLLDEAVIAVSAESSISTMDDLTAKLKVAMTEDPDVNMIGMMLLESADLNDDNIEKSIFDSYILVAKSLLRGNDDVGVFLAGSYDDLSNMVKKQLRILLTSEIGEIHHSFLIGPKFADRREEIQNLLIGMNENEKGQGVLESLGFKSWEKVDDEEMEFMIDLMDTLSV
ncbi:MAG: PhnD/SsuA/transferrin family substrate-binding protein [Methylococcaceae bacterium]|nr:PhnD/SsuA/transferrin family substrate-binding protein [Methylococcaceae bacterium]